MPDPAGSKSAGVRWLRGEPRQCGDRAHRLIPPSLAPTGERRPSMACLRPIPAPPRLSPDGCPWLRRSRLRHVPPKRRSPRREGRRCKGFAFEWYMDVPRPRVGAGRGTTRRTRTPCSDGPRPKPRLSPDTAISDGSPRSQGAPALFKLARSGITPSGEEAKKGRDIMSRPWRSHSAGRESASGRYGLTSTLAHSLLRNHLPPVKSGVCAWPGRCLTGAGRAAPAARCSRAWHARD